MVLPVFQYDGKTKYWKEGAFKEGTAETIKECLENVVKSGTGTGTRSYKMTIGGKTGTAEIKASQDDENGTELGWFVALTTDTKPEDSILIVTMVEDVEPKGGSAYVVSKTKKMLKSIYGNKF
jgi:penicillin-binding protein